MQLTLLQNPFAAEVEESGKRSVEGIRTHLDVQRLKAGRERAKYMTAVSALSEAMTSIAVALDKNGPRRANSEQTCATSCVNSKS